MAPTETASKASGTIEEGEVVGDNASITSATIKKRAPQKRGSGDGPLPDVTPKDNEEWLQAHLNTHAHIGYKKLV